MVKLPARTTANASFSMGANRQNEGLIPWTTNSSINNPGGLRGFPELAHLPRDTANMYVNNAERVDERELAARIKNVTLTARYRFYSRNDFTRPFEGVEYVRFDAVPEETGGETAPSNYEPQHAGRQRLVHGDPAHCDPRRLRDRQVRARLRTTEGWKDKTARVSVDTVGNQYFTVRALYEHTQRDLVGLSMEVEEMAMQPALRFFDEAARKRDRATLVLELTPVSTFGINFSLAYRQGRLRGRGQHAGVRSAGQQEHRVHGGRQLRAERQGEPWRRLRPRDVQLESGVAQRQPGAGSVVDRPEPQLDPDQRRDGRTTSRSTSTWSRRSRRPTSGPATTTATRTRRSSTAGRASSLALPTRRLPRHVRRASRTSRTSGSGPRSTSSTSCRRRSVSV